MIRKSITGALTAAWLLSSVPPPHALERMLAQGSSYTFGQGATIDCTDAYGRETFFSIFGFGPIGEYSISAWDCAPPPGYGPATRGSGWQP